MPDDDGRRGRAALCQRRGALPAALEPAREDGHGHEARRLPLPASHAAFWRWRCPALHTLEEQPAMVAITAVWAFAAHCRACHAA